MTTQIFKNLIRRKTRTCLTMLGIAIGVAMIVALGAMGEGLRSGYLAVFSGSGADLIVMQKGSYDITLSTVDQGLTAQIAKMPEVHSATGLIMGNVTAPGAPRFFLFGHEPNGFTIQRFKIVEGTALATAQHATTSSQVLLGKQATEALKLQVGDVIRIQGSAFRVAGIYSTGSSFEDAGAVAALPDAQQLLQKQRQVSAIQIKLKDVRALEQVRARIERLYPKLSVSQSAQAASQQQMVGYAEGFALGIALLAVVIGGVGMMNTVMMSAFERTRELGTLRALGWSRGRVLIMVLAESLVLSSVGGVIGCIFGAGLIGLVGSSPALAFLQGKLTLPLLSQGLLTASVLGGVGGLYPAWWASRLLPIEALRYEVGAGGNAVSSVSNIGIQVESDTLKSLWRRRGRTVLTISGISIALAAIVALGSIAASFSQDMTKLFGAGQVDLMVRQTDSSDIGTSVMNERVGKQLAAIPGVASVSGMIFGAVTMEGDVSFLLVMGYDPEERAIRNFRIVEGRALSGGREIIVGRAAADILKARMGDMVRLGEMSFRVVGIFETSVSWQDSGGIISLRDAQTLYGKPRQVSVYGVQVQDPRQIDTVRAQIQANITTVTPALSSDASEVSPKVASTYAMVWAVGALAIIVGGIGMMNTMIMSVFERTREIGTLRALGWRRRRVLNMVLKESLALCLIGLVVGIAASYALGMLLIQVPPLGEIVGKMIVDGFTPSLLLGALVLALGLGAIGGLYPAWRAGNLSPVEALRYE